MVVCGRRQSEFDRGVGKGSALNWTDSANDLRECYTLRHWCCFERQEV